MTNKQERKRKTNRHKTKYTTNKQNPRKKPSTQARKRAENSHDKDITKCPKMRIVQKQIMRGRPKL